MICLLRWSIHSSGIIVLQEDQQFEDSEMNLKIWTPFLLGFHGKHSVLFTLLFWVGSFVNLRGPRSKNSGGTAAFLGKPGLWPTVLRQWSCFLQPSPLYPHGLRLDMSGSPPKSLSRSVLVVVHLLCAWHYARSWGSKYVDDRVLA